MMREMSWGLELQGIDPAAKLLAIYIGDCYGTGNPDLAPIGGGHIIDVKDAAKFCCIDASKIGDLLEKIPGLKFYFRGLANCQVLLPVGASK